MLWLGFFPTMFYVENDALNCVILFLTIALMLHAYTMRPYCTEFDDEEEEAMMEMGLASGGADGMAGVASLSHHATTRDISSLNAVDIKDNQEEWKLVCFVIVLLCTVGSCIAFTMGGADVLHSWLAPAASPCSVKDLVDLQNSYARFHCSDGFVDLSQQRSILQKGGTLVKTYNEHRIAPVYLKKPSGTDIPVAWAVSKNLKLTGSPCGETGLCGIFTSKVHASDKAAFHALRDVAHLDVVKQKDSSKEIDKDSIPTVILTSLADPEGKAVYFYVGAILYFVVLLGLCNTQWSMFFEAPSKLDADNFFASKDDYDELRESTVGGMEISATYESQ